MCATPQSLIVRMCNHHKFRTVRQRKFIQHFFGDLAFCFLRIIFCRILFQLTFVVKVLSVIPAVLLHTSAGIHIISLSTSLYIFICDHFAICAKIILIAANSCPSCHKPAFIQIVRVIFPFMNAAFSGKHSVIFKPVPFAFYFYQSGCQASVFIDINLCFSIFVKAFFLYKSAIFAKDIKFVIDCFLSCIGTCSLPVKIISVLLVLHPAGFADTLLIEVVVIFLYLFYFILYIGIVYFILISRSLANPAGLSGSLYRQC